MSDRLAVIGLGRMGAALAATLLRADYAVTVWNRTPAKAQPLVELGARHAGTAAEAVAGSDIVVVCVGNYNDAAEALADCEDLSGKTLVQLTTGTAASAETLQAWAVSKRARYLDGVIIAYPSDIGREETVLALAGSEEAWERSEAVVKCLGGASVYTGSRLSAPIALESAMVAPSLMATMGMILGAHNMEQAGLDVGAYAEMMPGMAQLLTQSLQHQARAIATSDFSNTEAALDTWAAALNHNTDAFGKHGDIDLLKPVRELLNMAVDAGYGNEEISAAIKILRQTGGEE